MVHLKKPFVMSAFVCMCAKSLQLCLFATLLTVARQAPWDSPGKLEWVAMRSSRGSS